MGVVDILAMAVTLGTTPLAPATLLSRYPAGKVPDIAAVHEALDTIEESGDADDLALLQTLSDEEAGPVQEHAARSLDAVGERVRTELRAQASKSVPTPRQLDAVIAKTPQLEGVPRAERSVLAYAMVHLGQRTESAGSVGGLTPQEANEHIKIAEVMELDGRGDEAVRHLLDAALSGSTIAAAALRERGIDVERLGLALSSPLATSLGLPALAASPVVTSGDPTSVSVLIDRAERAPTMPRLAALDNLGQLIVAGRLAPDQAARARRALARAAQDPRQVVAYTARSALAASPGQDTGHVAD